MSATSSKPWRRKPTSASPASAKSTATSSSKSPNRHAPRLKEPPRLSLAARQRQADEVFARLAAVDPAPRCELFYNTPFQLLVSVVLSAQATDKMVNVCMEPVYKAGFTVDDLLALGEDGLLPIVRRISFAPTKTRHLVRLAALLNEQHGGQVPRTREELEALPGVGRKTANVILAEIYGEPTLAVDTHVFRVGRRLGLHAASTPEKAEAELMLSVKARHRPKAHHWLILHGRYTCKALRPECERCALNDICPSYVPARP